MPCILIFVIMLSKEEIETLSSSELISRDLSWLNFNHRVLDQAMDSSRNLFDRLKFLAISSSNLDEFCAIRLGSLYNYIDFSKKRIDYCGLREIPFRHLLLKQTKEFVEEQKSLFDKELTPLFKKEKFNIVTYDQLTKEELEETKKYFLTYLYPMLTPTKFDSYHSFPLIRNKILVLGVVTITKQKNRKKRHVSFLQIPKKHPFFL